MEINSTTMRVLELRRQGMTLEKIGAAIGGKSRETVRQIVRKGERLTAIVRKHEETGIKSFDMLSVRSANVLIGCGVRNCDHLYRLGPRFIKTMLREPNFGKNSYKELLEFMGWTEENVQEDCRRIPWHHHIRPEELIKLDEPAAKL